MRFEKIQFICNRFPNLNKSVSPIRINGLLNISLKIYFLTANEMQSEPFQCQYLRTNSEMHCDSVEQYEG